VQQIRPQLWLLGLVIFITSLVLRLLAIQVPINIDEDDWMRFSLHFVRALMHADLAETYRWHHPGVPIMWINGVSQSLYCLSHGLLDSANSLPPSLDACIESLLGQGEISLTALAIARTLQGIITSACMVYLFLLVRRLVGQAVALVGIGLLTVEPFFLAYQRLVVTDGLQIMFMTLATVSLLVYLRHDESRSLLVGSGIWMGLAVATKTPALMIVPVVALWLLLIELGVWRSHFPQRGLQQQTRDLLRWGAVAIGTFWLVFPAMWGAPLLTLGRLVAGLQAETERGYFFFMGTLTDAPSALYYPVVMLYRLSPVLLLGIALGLIVLLVPKLRRSLSYVPELTALLIASGFVLFVFSNSANKIDRYILPTLPALTLLAATGWLCLIQWIGYSVQRVQLSSSIPSKRLARMVAIALTSLLAVIQTAALVAHYPYYLTFFNPLVGGASNAQRVLMIGNGEGLDQAAQWFNQTFSPRSITVGSWYSPSFKPYSDQSTVEIGRKMEDERDRRWLYESNYVVFYINQLQRQLPSSEAVAYFTAQPPVHTVNLHGVDYVQIYPGTIARPADLSTVEQPQTENFGDRLRLRGYDVHPSANRQPLLLTLYWEVLKPPQPNLSVSVTVTEGNQTIGQSKSPLMGGLVPRRYLKPGAIIRDVHQIPLASGLSAGSYTLAIALNPNLSSQPGQTTSVQPVGTFTVN
jgi:hypothetical protein